MAVQNKTYNNVINTLKQLGTEHNQIQTTTTGDIFDIDLSKNTLFPLFHINPVSVTAGESTLTYNFQLFIMDAVSEKEDWTEANFQSADYLSNEQEVLSECLQICTDIIGIFTNSKWQSQLTNDIDAPVYFSDIDFTLEPFNERFDNMLTGWTFEIGIIVHNDFQTCNIPMDNDPIGK
tara:strand:+ start:91 stop:624 length:534 start_codon:yes stop_codon:yes gene_type:complete